MKPFFQVSGDAQRALEQFSLEFYGAFTAADPATLWAQQFGLVNASRNIRTTYPIPVSAAKYLERKGDDRLRSLYERSVSITPITWADGFAELANIIEAPDFIGWANEPTNVAREAARQPNLIVRDLLHNNANLPFYKDQRTGVDLGIPLFSASHPVNIFDAQFGTFSNLLSSTAIDGTLFSEAFQAFGTRKGANGESMHLKPTDLLVPPALEQKAKDFLQSDLTRVAFLEGGVGSQKNTNFNTNNRFQNCVNLVVGYELTDTNMIYFLDGTATAKPWILQTGGEPEQILYTKNDSLYKETGKVGVKYVLTMAAIGCLPHAIMRATIS